MGVVAIVENIANALYHPIWLLLVLELCDDEASKIGHALYISDILPVGYPCPKQLL